MSGREGWARRWRLDDKSQSLDKIKAKYNMKKLTYPLFLHHPRLSLVSNDAQVVCCPAGVWFTRAEGERLSELAGRGCRRNVPSTCNCSDGDGDGPFDAAAMSERRMIAGAMDGTTEWMMLNVWAAGEGLSD